MIDEILLKETLTKEDAITLLNIDNQSDDFYKLLAAANKLSRQQYKNKGYVFAQIGLNAEKCSGNCKFCSLAKDNFAIGSTFEKSKDEIIQQVTEIAENNFAALFLMTTADYSKDKFLEIGKQAKAIIGNRMDLVANIGDFDYEYALKLKEVGFTGAYHIVRLREGIDTDISPSKRIETLDAITKAGLKLYYCIEPIGKEHTYEEIADEMLRARKYNVDVMAVMRRVAVKGTKFEHDSDISEPEITKIAAVTRLVTNPKTSMNVHEPLKMPILAGVNQFYAELGVNPRDTKKDTELGRGFTLETVEKMLNEGEYYL